MKDPLQYLSDPVRLSVLAETGLMDSDTEVAFDRLTELAAEFLKVPLAEVNLVDERRQFSKSSIVPPGWPPGREASLQDAFCPKVVANAAPMVIDDTLHDARVCESRFVRDHHLRAYAGVPLTTDDGHTLGTLCVVDLKPRAWTPREIETLHKLAGAVLTEIQLRRELAREQGRLQQVRASERALRAEGERLRDFQHVVVRLATSEPMKRGDVAGTLRVLCQAATHTLDVARASVWRFDAEPGGLHCLELYARGMEAPVDAAVLRPEDAPAYFAALRGMRVIAADDARADPRTRALVQDYLAPRGIAALLDATIWRGGEVWGVFSLEHTGAPRAWSTDEQAFAASVADLAALAFEAAERERMEARLARKRTELERSNRELEAFAYVASHDLQEPLRKIQAFGDRLAQRYADSLGAEGGDYLARMRHAAARMQTLIQDLLVFSRVTTTAQPYRSVDLDETAAAILCDLQARIEQTGGRVDVGPLPRIRADETQMRQLLQNLVANALKFHRPGVPPRVRIHAPVQTPEHVELVVEDNGQGFEARYAEKVFEPFERLGGRGQEGTGIGLAICKKIVERHGGAIGVQSEPGAGTRFTVRLPTDPVPLPLP